MRSEVRPTTKRTGNVRSQSIQQEWGETTYGRMAARCPRCKSRKDRSPSSCSAIPASLHAGPGPGHGPDHTAEPAAASAGAEAEGEAAARSAGPAAGVDDTAGSAGAAAGAAGIGVGAEHTAARATQSVAGSIAAAGGGFVGRPL